MSTKPEYIGDALYATYEDGPMIQVFTERASSQPGAVVRHQVYFEPDTFLNLLRYANAVGWGKIVKRAARDVKD